LKPPLPGQNDHCDPKGLNFRKYDGATMLTPNLKEAASPAG
jgi:bifunctional ADP-heptose synthase (sugar kinase/adenylyltransferase)